MKDSRSPIIDFYPTDFRVDQEGKRNDWEGIVLVPFIDEARLLQVDEMPSRVAKGRRSAHCMPQALLGSALRVGPEGSRVQSITTCSTPGCETGNCTGAGTLPLTSRCHAVVSLQSPA